MVDHLFFPCPEPWSIAKLFSDLNMETPAAVHQLSATIEITGVATPQAASEQDICFVSKAKYLKELEHSSAAVALLGPDMVAPETFAGLSLHVQNPHMTFVQFANLICPNSARNLAELPHRQDLPSPILEEGVVVSSGAVIGNGAEIGSGTLVGANSVIGPNVKIGRNCLIESNVTIECAYLGDDVVVRAGARIGGIGFGFLDHAKRNIAVPQLGRVIMQNHTEVGVNSVVDRGALGDTEIAENAKVGNMVQIGHNCRIGRNAMIAPMCGLSGATMIGESVIMAAGAQSAGHLTIGANSFVHAGAAVTKDWPEESRIIGAPARPASEFWREMAFVRKLSRGDNK